MKAKKPITRHRPVKTSDGEGGFVTTLSSPLTIWGYVVIHKEETKVEGVDINEDVAPEDILEIQE